MKDSIPPGYEAQEQSEAKEAAKIPEGEAAELARYDDIVRTEEAMSDINAITGLRAELVIVDDPHNEEQGTDPFDLPPGEIEVVESELDVSDFNFGHVAAAQAAFDARPTNNEEGVFDVIPTRFARYYIAGPMTNLPRFNIPQFDEVAAHLRLCGFVVISPAELDSPEMRAAALASDTGDMRELAHLGETWGDVLARDVRIIEQQVDVIVLLPDWMKSRGARLEAFVGLLTGKRFYKWRAKAQELQAVGLDWVREHLRQNMP